jgi:membrane-bound ClpP family serine protease
MLPAHHTVHLWRVHMKGIAIIGGAISVFAGLMLLSISALSHDSIFESISHGIGCFCIGQGLLLGGILWSLECHRESRNAAATPTEPSGLPGSTPQSQAPKDYPGYG